MNLGRTGLLSETHHSHLRAATLDGALETRVGLHPIHGKDEVGAGGVVVEEQGHATRCSGNLAGCHRHTDVTADRFFRDAQRGQQCALPFGSSTGMTPHRRHNKGLGTECPQSTDRTTQGFDPLGQTPTAGANGNSPALQRDRGETVPNRRGHRRFHVVHCRRAGNGQNEGVQGRNGQGFREREVDSSLQLCPTCRVAHNFTVLLRSGKPGHDALSPMLG